MTRYILPLLCATALTLASCGTNTEGGTSMPSDTTNSTGAAPVNYQEGKPDQPVSPATTGSDEITDDTTGKASSGWAEPNGHGANTSNTTDRRTTSGSANQGDADGDRKR